MLAALLLAGIVAAPLGSVLLFLPANGRIKAAGAWPAIRRFVLAVVGTALLAVAVAGVLKLLRVSEHSFVSGVASVVIASLIWLPVTRRWNARAHLCWASSIFLFVTYLVFALDWTFTSHLGLASTIGALLLWVFELFAAIMACAYLWEICDALGTEHWTRRVTPQVMFNVPSARLPMVSLHVPAHNEPPDMVIDTLRSLLRIDYPRYEIILIDDNTDDEALWRPVQAWCRRHGVKFAHLEDWPGYKSGALNYALREMTDERAEIIGVVDSDYQIEPAFLRRCAPAFAEPWVGFVQSPQDYRGWAHAPYYRRLYYSYKYFFAVSQPSRNERDGAIFAGTMGLIRRVALEQLGGGALFRKLTLFLVATVPVLVALGLVRAVALLRRGTGASWRDAIGAFFIWQSTSLVVARASVLGLFARKAAFLRTPKTSERARWWEALRANWAESLLALLGLAGIVAALSKPTQLSGLLLAALLIFPTLGMAAAPFNSWAARRAALPAALRARRTTEYRRDRRSFAAGAAVGAPVAGAAVVFAPPAPRLAPGPPLHGAAPAGPAHGQT